MQFMLRFLRIMRDYALMLAATNYAQYYAGIMYASLEKSTLVPINPWPLNIYTNMQRTYRLQMVSDAVCVCGGGG